MSQVNELRLLLVGFGNVGRELARLLVHKHDALLHEGLRARVVGIVTRSRGAVVEPRGVDLQAAIHAERLGPEGNGGPEQHRQLCARKTG